MENDNLRCADYYKERFIIQVGDGLSSDRHNIFNEIFYKTGHSYEEKYRKFGRYRKIW